jgi:uncharacterized protein involved in exopolysaccharide biosynthesis
MSRDKATVTLQSLARLQADYATAQVAYERLSAKRRAAIIKAVEAGNAKAAVARVVGVIPSRVSAIVKEG